MRPMNGGIYPKGEVHSPDIVSGFFIDKNKRL
jgi:hypothetical protein